MSFIQRLSSEYAYLTGSLRALGKSGSVSKDRTRTVREFFEDLAARYADRLALVSDRESLTYGQLNAQANRYARWARGLGLGKGDTVALFMPNRPEFIACWAGVARMGGATALVNTNLVGSSLAHCIGIVNARAVIVDASLAQAFATARGSIDPSVKLFVHGEIESGPGADLPRIDQLLAGFSTANLPASDRVALTIDDKCLYIYTSGTTGMPKAAIINQSRTLRIMLGFSGATGARESDIMYVTLPLYHATGGLCATGAVFAVGGTAVLRDKFSARQFWEDARSRRCTMFVYVGELCRYLMAAPPSPQDRDHQLRMCFGNGLRPDIFEAFSKRFGLPHILEFYAATEGNISLFNFDSRAGSVGRIPKWAERRFRVKIVSLDPETDMPRRGRDGFCIECAPGESGEIVGQILDDPKFPTNRFEGYADGEATSKKILRDAFSKGDAWFRSGDLLKKDAQGYFYFVDRIGDTFRWKGENVSTTEVADALTGFAGVRDATVYGIAVPGYEGRAGMAALVVDDPASFDFEGLRRWIDGHLPDYARPVFLRFQDHLDVTGTFKQRKTGLMAEGFDPGQTSDRLFFGAPKTSSFAPIDAALFEKITSGTQRL